MLKVTDGLCSVEDLGENGLRLTQAVVAEKKALLMSFRRSI
jgi:hypothetical protein